MRRLALALLLPLFPAAAAPAAADPPAPRAGDPPVPRRLLLNEVDYDQPSFDTGEFVEIVNAGDRRYRLRHVALILVNGATSAEYRRIQLSGPLGPGRTLVIATPAVAVAEGARSLSLPLARDNVQNGSPDAIALFDTANGVLLDAVSYEGAIDDAAFDDVPATWPLVAGSPVVESDGNVEPASVCRLPDRANTGDDDADWSACHPTPGAANSA